MCKRSILIFGCGVLQRSLIQKARAMNLYTIGIDPCADAVAREAVHVFEVVGGQDYEKTLAIARKYAVSALVTVATDKPLLMMARVASALSLPFFSTDTANWSTDKWQMKQRFLQGGVPCAQGRLLSCAEEAFDMPFPIIIKPRDNSGSRGVRLCSSKEEVRAAFSEASDFSHLKQVLAEEVIEGQEYSMEGLHFDGRSEVLQFTEKQTTPFPYNVEIAHCQPARLSEQQQNTLKEMLRHIGKCMSFAHCASHTEFKINKKGIFVIESSPRTGGDYIASDLVPLSTGIDMETQLLHVALGEKPELVALREERSAGVSFFHFPEGHVFTKNEGFEALANEPGITHWNCCLNAGDKVPMLTHSLNRYGEYIFSAATREELDERRKNMEQKIRNTIKIK